MGVGVGVGVGEVGGGVGVGVTVGVGVGGGVLRRGMVEVGAVGEPGALAREVTGAGVAGRPPTMVRRGTGPVVVGPGEPLSTWAGAGAGLTSPSTGWITSVGGGRDGPSEVRFGSPTTTVAPSKTNDSNATPTTAAISVARRRSDRFAWATTAPRRSSGSAGVTPQRGQDADRRLIHVLGVDIGDRADLRGGQAEVVPRYDDPTALRG